MSNSTRRIVDWRKAIKEGKTAGSIWTGRGKGDALQNQHQREDPDKTAVAAGNQYGSALIKMYKNHGVVIIKEPGKPDLKIPIARPGFDKIPPVQ